MQTSIIEVRDMLSVLGIDEVEKRIGEVPGVESVTVDFAAENATVRFDETRIENADIKSAVRQRGIAAGVPADGASGMDHRGHAAMGEPPAPVATVPPTSTLTTPAIAAVAPDKPASTAMAEPPAVPVATAGDASEGKPVSEKG